MNVKVITTVIYVIVKFLINEEMSFIKDYKYVAFFFAPILE